MRLLGCVVPAIHTPECIRALKKDFRPASSESVERYLASKFGDHLEEVRAAISAIMSGDGTALVRLHFFMALRLSVSSMAAMTSRGGSVTGSPSEAPATTLECLLQISAGRGTEPSGSRTVGKPSGPVRPGLPC